MQRRWWLTLLAVSGLFVGVLPAVDAGATAEQTLLHFRSEPGDYIGGGQTVTLTEADVDFTPTQVNPAGSVRFSIDNFDRNEWPNLIWWYATFSPPAGEPLAEGLYNGATRWPFQASSDPGLDFSGQGRGCNQLSGRFHILEAEYDANGNVEHFAADFEQHCENGDPALFGVIRYRSTVPVPTTMFIGDDTTLTGDHYGNVVVNGNNLVLDCAGYRVYGIGTDPVGINVNSRSGVIVRNCDVSLFEFGIFYANSTGGAVEANTAHDNTSQGVALNSSSEVLVVGNETFGNTTAGIGLADADGGNVVVDNESHDNPRAGIDLFFADDNEVTNNTVAGNGDFGVLLNNATDNTVSGNLAQASEGDGFHISGGGNNTILANEVTANTHGFSLTDTTGNWLEENDSKGNAHFGFVSWGADANTYHSNLASGNGSDGIHLGRANDVDPSEDNVITNNEATDNHAGISTYFAANTEIAGNEAIDNRDWGFAQISSTAGRIDDNLARNNRGGFLFWGGSSGWALDSNRAVNNEFHGFVVGDAGSNIGFRENEAVGNGGRGFFVLNSGDIELIGNTASGHDSDGTTSDFGSGFSLWIVTDAYLEGNVSTENYHGFRIEQTVGTDFVGNDGSYNVVGFDIFDSHGNNFDSNTANYTGERSGFEITAGSSNNYLSNNTANHNNQWAGFAVWDGHDNVLFGNTATKNKVGFGVWKPSTGNVFESNYARNAWLDALDDTEEGDNTWTDNDFKWVEGSGGWR